VNLEGGFGGEWLAGAPQWLRGTIEWLWEEHKRDLLVAAWAGFWGVTRLAGKTVNSGEIGVKFSFGRAVRVCEPGFYPLIPIFQTIRVTPSRARTLDLPLQRLTTGGGLVYEVDANVVYRVVDPRKAFIEIDSLESAMLQVLGLSVYEVLADVQGAELRVSDTLDRQLVERMTARLEPWGVAVERAGFATLHPSRETIRITQLARLAATRAAALAGYARSAEGGASLGLLGAAGRFVSHTRNLRAREIRSRRRRYVPRFLQRFETFADATPSITKSAPRAAALALAKERYERLLAR